MKFIWKYLTTLACVLATLALGVIASGFAGYYYLQPVLPSVEEMRDKRLQIPLRIYSRDGQLIGQVGEKKRMPVAYDDIPPLVVQAFLAAEDDRFFEHPGFDYQGIVRAAVKLITTGSRAQGGSTITQQLAREYFLTRDRTFVRKAKELILAIQIESEFPKTVILELYLNKIFLGQRSYGVAAAAEVYFGKTLEELSIAEAATIAGLPAAPSRLNPVASPDEARGRREYVLRRMHELGFINDEEYSLALNTPVVSRLHGPQVQIDAAYATEIARAEMIRRYGDKAYTDGYQVITTIDSRLQQSANNALRQALVNYDRRHGYRGPIDQVLVDEIVANYLATLNEAEDEFADTNIAENIKASFALQNFLSNYPDYKNLNIAIVTGINTEDNSAALFVRDAGEVKLAWERIKWRNFRTDDIVGDEPESVSDVLATGDVVYLLDSTTGYWLGQMPLAQGAFVAINPLDGATIAMTGGFDHSASSFNRASAHWSGA
jgi:penicillin-binding protein 1A